MKNNKYMKEAIRLSDIHMKKGHGGPFGAVIVLHGKIVGRGWNQVTSTNDPTAHAEVSAIREACKKLKTFDLSEAEIYTSCEPCPMCLAAIYWSRINKVYYANTRIDAAKILFDDDFLYKEISKPISKRKLKMKQIMRSEAQKVFKGWMVKADKVPY
jgi:tRNA(Arg) A34 adenosine deaminase TadA